MGENTNIEWADHSWNPWRGCTKVSPGCANCYAETWSRRNPAVLGNWGKGKPRVLAKNWVNPLRWNCTKICTNCGQANRLDALVCSAISCAHFEFRRLRVFPSLCDWLDEEVPIAWLAQFLKLIHDTPNIDWLLLTKRPELFRNRMNKVACTVSMERGQSAVNWLTGNPPANVWVGTSVEDQTRADERIPALLDIPAKLRFLSVEPLLALVDLSMWLPNCDADGDTTARHNYNHPDDSIHWVIVGGESGPRSRPCNVEWIRSIVRQCKQAGVPCFVKQLGSVCVDSRLSDPMSKGAGWPPRMMTVPGIQWIDRPRLALKHPKGGDPDEWPEDLRVRQFPEVKP